ncbi:hypothetical protein HPP92_000824 [Vanilla planifolia]|uniref:AIR9-like A9 domain-containing protein n=1 Tax=Vanilla planifolia TaxID=51239 RepID=A0A835VJ47_VANPL|nr:hypothetical protein HPP92_000824 [Vanilla planifolia]
MDTISASKPKDAREISCSVPTVKRSQVTSSKSVSGVMRTSKNSEASTAGKAASVQSAVRKTEGTAMPDSNLSRFLRPTLSSSASSQRRNSTGNFRDKQAVATAKQTSTDGKIVSPSISDSGKKASLGSRKALLPSVSSKDLTPDASMKGKRSPAFSVLPQTSDSGKADSMRKSSSRSLESSRRVLSSSLESSSGISSIKKATSNGFSLPERTSFSASANRVSSVVSSKKNSSAAESRDYRFIMLPQVDFKARDDLRLDLRGHKIRSLDAPGLNLSPSLEFVYLRDNLLSSMVGVEILKRVKVLDLSFNDFKGPSFEPLGSCKALQQLYLAGNQITTLSSIPELPNLEFLSVAQNKLKSLAMATQPRLQVLAASKNKISTFKGFPFLPVLEHLRVEENPILRMTHVEAASILLVGPTLKKFNDQDLSLKELEIAKSYPAHTPVCIRDGWEFCRPELAADSTFSFLLEKWKEHFPPGFMLSGTSVDSPFEDDICRCHFNFINVNSDADLVLKYQWLVGDRTPTNFEIIADAVGEVYWPKHEDIGKYLKVECTPILMEKVYPPVFAISSPVSPGTGYPKVLSLIVHGELIEGNLIRGAAEISWCGGTPGKGVASWLRRRWNGSPVVVVGAEDEDYLLTADDIDSSLVFMYTPVTEEGTKGEPQYAMTDFVKAAPPSVSNVRILGDAVEGNTIKGIGEYFGGKEGPSKFKWMREDKETGNFVVVSSGASEYTLTKNDIGHRLAFVYIPANFEGGKSVSVMSEIVKKVTNLMIVGDVREGSKLTVSCTVVGGTEGSCRVQWFKTSYSMFENENSMEAISSSKLAKTFRVPLAAVGYYIVVKFTPVASDGETGESAFAISDKVVDSLPPSLNFLSTEGAAGVLIAKGVGLLQCLITKDYIGKLISFECTPVRDDGIVGELRTFLAAVQVRSGSPRLLYLKIIGDGVEGTTLHAEKKYWGGEEGNSVYQWLQISPIGTVSEIKGATHAFI